jgi:hypothetical protein
MKKIANRLSTVLRNRITEIKNSDGENCCCGPSPSNNIDYCNVAVCGKIATAHGEVEVVPTQWNIKDYIGWLAVRINIHRMDYAIKPGIYAVGAPDKESPVLVSGNYKLSFDVLRKNLEGLNVWILVLDTKGINVWCAAGKGTFGTMEIVRRVGMTGLEQIVSTRKLIVPQLGAPGVAAHIVYAFCGFSVAYGPVRAQDIRRYIESGMKADEQMRRVEFNLIDRLAVTFVEIALVLKKGLLISFLMALAGFVLSRLTAAPHIVEKTILFLCLFWMAIISGSILNAVLLPFLPGRAFSFKGWLLSAVITTVAILMSGYSLSVPTWIFALLFMPATSAYIAMNYTGCSTFTSLSGVNKEIKYALPVIIAMICSAVAIEIFVIAGRLL